MSSMTGTANGAKRAQTFIPDLDTRDQLLDFAEFMREIEEHPTAGSSKAALVDPDGGRRAIPDEIFKILDQVTNALAAGHGVTIVPQGMKMTTQQAADFLGVSRPTLVRLLEDGAIEYERPGRHRRVPLEALLDYQQAFRAERRAALRKLAKANMSSRVKVGSASDLVRATELTDE